MAQQKDFDIWDLSSLSKQDIPIIKPSIYFIDEPIKNWVLEVEVKLNVREKL